MKFTPLLISVSLLSILYLSIMPANLYAQQNPEWLVYNTTNSELPDNQVNDLIIDDNNVIWIATESGLARFDGTWKIFNTSKSGLSIPHIESILIDKEGNKWITGQEGSTQGFTKFDDVTWKTFNRSNSEFPFDAVNSFALDSIGNKWIGTNEGLIKYDGMNWTVYNVYNSKLPGNLVFALETDQKGNIWAGTNEGLAKFDGTNWTVYTDSNSDLPCNHIWDLATDDRGNIWIATENCGFARFDGTTWSVFNKSNSDLPDNEIIGLSNVINGTIWVGTEGRGLSKFQNNSWTNYHVLNSGLPNDIVIKIFIDKVGNNWICTQGGGLAVFKEGGIDIMENPEEIQLFFNYKKSFSLTKKVKNVLPPTEIVKDKAYDSRENETESQLNENMSLVHQDIHFDRISVQEGLSQSTVRCIYQDSKGFMWFGTDDGLNKYDGYQLTAFKHDPENLHSLRANRVNSINEDKYGLLWIETAYGVLHKFNRETEIFSPYKNDKGEILRLRKLSAFVDTLGTFWLDEFGLRRYRNKRLQRDGKSSDFAKFLYIDDSGGWWIGTDKGELENFQGDHKSTKHYSHSAYNSNSLSHDDITSIVQDNSGRIWIGTVNGLNKFDLQKDKITRYLYQPGILNTLTANRINALCLTNSGEIWIGTHGDGLYNFNLKTEKFMHYVHDSNNPNSLSDNVILSIYEDRSGMIWVGTFVGGINRINPNQKKFSHSHHDPENPKSISYNMITSIFEDTSGVLWIGTDGGGLNKINTGDLDISTPRWTHYKNNPYNPNSISGDKILSIYQDRMGDMWVGTAEGGLNKFLHSSNEKSSAFIHYKHFPGNPRSLSTDEVTCIYEDISNQFWIGTGRGLNKFNRQTETFISYHSDPNNPKSLSNDGITCIYEDRKANMWVGTENGLNKFDRQTETFSRYIYDPENPISRIYNEITSIYEDKSGILWVGSATGLNRFDQKNDVFLRYTKKDGLPDNVICGILEDDDKNLWLSTKNGLSKFSLRTGKFRNFDRHDGLQSNEFNDGAYCKTNSGHLIFGGVNGLSYFYPKEKRDNPHRPPIVITDFQISNISVPIGGQFIKKSISETKEIQLSYEERVFSFEFAALDFQIPEKNQYAYMLEGFDREWIYTDATRRFATYTNLDPGEYIFKVKGSNNQGLWNETGTSINITITPPWWLTNWAYAVYFILVVITLYALRTYDQKRQNLKLELELEHLHTKKLEEIDRMKSRFFANISHEFRTPLTLILGPIERMISGELQENLHEQYKLIRRNGKRLLQLINQLLDLSKLESDKLKLKTRATDIIHMINGLVQAFESLAAQKNITLNFKSEIDSQEIYLDVDKFEKIINNLLFNAFKFTPENGNIEILVCTGEAFPGNFQNNPQTFDQNASPLHSSPQQSKIIEIFITNTGPGIPKDKIDKIFDRFYQVDDSYTKDDEGTGIGLALTKELVELHHGTIDVHCTNADKQPPNSPFSMGDLFCTTFTVSLPFGKDHLKPEEIVEELEAGDRSEQSGDPDMSGRPETGKPISQDSIPEADTRYQIPDTEKHISNPESRIPHLKSSIEHRASSSIPHPVSRIPYPESRILLVEDNADLRHYIRSNMDGQYRFSEAENGEEGFKKAKKDIPDLIISDVMMPKMDGFEFCANIKTDERTSHIPVILMTARAEQEDKLEGLETGADDYITKPFDNKELLIRVKNLIEQRRKMRERFTRESSLIIDKIAHTSTDEKFVNRVINIISQHISEANFNVESLTEEIGMSRMHLHRKILGLFGQTPGVFLRTIRLKRGAELLKEKSGNISEISYEVGFDNPSYFGLCFRRQFGLSPSDYCKKSSEQLKCYKI